MNTTFYIVRHGESESNALSPNERKNLPQREYGALLTVKGKNQAKKLGEELNVVQFDAIYSSDLIRARESAEIIIREMEHEVILDKLLRERNKGRLGRMTEEEIKKEFSEQHTRFESLIDDEKFSFKYLPEIESDKESAARLSNVLLRLSKVHNGKTVMIVCHGAVMRSFLIQEGYAAYSQLPSGSLENCGYIIVQTDGENFEIKNTVGVHKKYDK